MRQRHASVQSDAPAAADPAPEPGELPRQAAATGPPVVAAREMPEGRGSPAGVERLLVVTHVTHFRCADRLYAYGPYARELELWCDLFPQVIIAAPIVDGAAPTDCHPVQRSNLQLRPVAATGGKTPAAKLGQLARLPGICWRLTRAMRKADAIHVRCPGNLGLLGALLAPLYCRRLVAKYAGTWVPYPDEPRSVRLQRRILQSRWWKGPVTVYGRWAGLPDHVIPFFTSVMNAEDMGRARAAAALPRPNAPFRILYVGRLSQPKHVDVLLRAVAQLVADGTEVACTVIGVGPERQSLERLVDDLELTASVRFAGGLEFEAVLEHYARAHALVLASDSEGWPKAIAEGMAFGLACVGSDRGLVPWMLGEGRGLLVPPGETEPLARALHQLAGDAALRNRLARRAANWAQRYTLEGLSEALGQLLCQRWESPAGGLSAGRHAAGRNASRVFSERSGPSP